MAPTPYEGQHDPFFPLLMAAEHTARLQVRYGGLVDRIGISCYFARPYHANLEAWAEIIAACRHIPAGRP
jgi:hypothetical protein